MDVVSRKLSRSHSVDCLSGSSSSDFCSASSDSSRSSRPSTPDCPRPASLLQPRKPQQSKLMPQPEKQAISSNDQQGAIEPRTVPLQIGLQPQPTQSNRTWEQDNGCYQSVGVAASSSHPWPVEAPHGTAPHTGWSAAESNSGDVLLPSRGSAQHESGLCQPCIFWFKDQCIKGAQCIYCHLIHPGQKNKRFKPSKKTRADRRATHDDL